MYEKDYHVVDMVGVLVINKLHDNYRRAGFVLKSGSNELPPVNYATYRALESDPDLVVSVIVADNENVHSGAGGGQNVDQVAQPVNQLTRAELLNAAVIEFKLNPAKYQTKKGELSISAFRKVVSDDVTLDEVLAEINGMAE